MPNFTFAFKKVYSNFWHKISKNILARVQIKGTNLLDVTRNLLLKMSLFKARYFNIKIFPKHYPCALFKYPDSTLNKTEKRFSFSVSIFNILHLSIPYYLIVGDFHLFTEEFQFNFPFSDQSVM
jgi:hypothetical protein